MQLYIQYVSVTIYVAVKHMELCQQNIRNGST